MDEVTLCEDPIFVIGSPRSATTATAYSLALHPELFVSKESYFIQQLFGSGKVQDVWQSNIDRVTPSWIREEDVDLQQFLRSLGVGINHLYSTRSAGKRWVDHTPRYTPMVDTIAAMFPGAKFLHVLRDGRSVVRSMGNFERLFSGDELAAMSDEMPTWTTDFVAGCQTWAEYVSVALSFAQREPDRCLTIRNEEISADPEAGFAAIFEFLGIADHAQCAKRFGENRINTSFRTHFDQKVPGWVEWPSALRETFVQHAAHAFVLAGFGDQQTLDEWAEER